MFRKKQVFYICMYGLVSILCDVLVENLNTKQCLNENSFTMKCNHIPKTIPEGVSEVQVTDFINTDEPWSIAQSDFDIETWKFVQILKFSDQDDRESPVLTFNAMCFGNLKSLRTLEIHIVQAFELNTETFVGLDNVTTLDMSNCGRLELETLFLALNEPDKLPRVENLVISRLSYKIGPLTLQTGGGFEYLANKRIKSITVVNSQISILRTNLLSSVKTFEVINISYSNVADMAASIPEPKDLINIKSLDLSYIGFPLLTIIFRGKFEVTNQHFDIFDFYPPLKLLLTPESVNISGLFLNRYSFWLRNCTATLKEDLGWNVQHLVAKQNGIEYLDLDIDCKDIKIYSLVSVVLSRNDLLFLHPSILTCFPNITQIDLSKNQLHFMTSTAIHLFEKLLTSLSKLLDMSLSGNDLETIPRSMFRTNEDLQVIDLAFNKLSQIEFDLVHLKHLKRLILHDNRIQFLDSRSVKSLQYLGTGTVITIKDNPFSCKECESKEFYQWFLSANSSDTEQEKLQCVSEDEVSVDVTELVVKDLDSVCERKVIIISTASVVGTCLVLTLVIIFTVYKRLKHINELNSRKTAIQLLHSGQFEYEFATFLSYSSNDENFVERSVCKQLEENLRRITGINRTLVCIGDLNLRPGFCVLDETVRCIQRSASVIIVASNNFCGSIYCHNELQQAYQMNKPILLIFKETVDEKLMTPVMKLLFKQNVRILFEKQNEEYVLKNTWDNVCESIIDLIGHQVYHSPKTNKAVMI